METGAHPVSSLPRQNGTIVAEGRNPQGSVPMRHGGIEAPMVAILTRRFPGKEMAHSLQQKDQQRKNGGQDELGVRLMM